MTPLKHQRLIANAGSGKTYRLVTRYLELLKRDLPAESIIALTFTRKAAGEFMDRIFQRLCQGTDAGDPESGLSAAECASHLRQLVEKLPRLSLGTLDSFLGRMVRAFPFECGLAGDLSLMDGHGLEQARREALEALFQEQSSQGAFAEFLELIRQQNRNNEKRNVTEALQREIQSLHEAYLLTPRNISWGEPGTIWPQGSPILEAGELAPLVTRFAEELRLHHSDMTEEYQSHWDALLDDLRRSRPGSVVSERALKFAAKALDPPPVPKDPESFFLTVFRSKRFAFPESKRPLVEALGRAILRIEFEGRLARSRALHALLAGFESHYQKTIREAGRLTFTDITGLLAAAEGATWTGGNAKARLDRRQMDFRLDSRYDHWLFDEFQDTSQLQWQALRNLVDEVVQSDTGQRSFFYVGDTKQAIYTWRGGDPKLFDTIADYYNASGTSRIDTSEALDISRRSAPEILEVVNRIFDPDHLDRLAKSMKFPAETLARWRGAWRHHKPDDQHPPGRGYVEWRTFEDEENDRRQTLDEECARLIAEIDPLAKGLSCGVLVQTNAVAASIIETLRAAGLEARSEGNYNPCADNEVGVATLSLFRALAHPDDTWASRHVEMTPFHDLLGSDFARFRREALEAFRSQGIANTLTRWTESLPISGNAFARNRANALIATAAEFEASQSGASLDALIAEWENQKSVEEPSGGTIRVLTIHAAKGLDFDMVVLPQLDKDPLSSARRDSSLHLQQTEAGSIAWGMDLPGNEVCQLDPILQAAAEDDLATSSYENLCVYYVALTRAKSALYLLSRRLKANSTDRKFDAFLHQTLPRDDNRFALGNPDWHHQHNTQPRPAPTDLIPLSGPGLSDPVPERPSENRDSSPLPAIHFLKSHSRLSLGTEVHRALARITWLPEGLPNLDDLSDPARELVEKFLQSDCAAGLFTPPDSLTALWREKSFDVRVNGRWISGSFDRVVLTDKDAQIIDYKTDEREEIESHRPQLLAYRDSLAALTGQEPKKIHCSLIYVRSGRKVVLNN